MYFRSLISAFLFTFCAVIAQAGEIITARAWVEDPTGKMTLAQVKQAPQTPFENAYFTQGFSSSTFWLRIRIDPRNVSKDAYDNELVVRISPAMQDQIQLFDPLDQKNTPRFTGDYFDWANDEYRSLNLNFVIPIGDEPRDIWLKLNTHQSTMTMVEVMTMEEARAADRRQEFFTMIYFALLIVCMGWGILSYFTQRDFLIRIYIWREVAAISYALVVLGYFRIFTSGWLSASHLDAVSNYIVFVFVAYVIWFDSWLISEFKPNVWFIRLLRATSFIVPIEILLFALGYEAIAVIMNGYVVIVAVVLVSLAIISTKAWKETINAPLDQRPVFPKSFLIGIYSVVVVVVIFNRLSVMGIVQAQQVSLYVVLVYALLSSIAMMVLVLVRAQRLRKRQEYAQHQLELAEIEATQERERRIEQSNFLKMLAHEMKTPLSVVRMTLGSAAIEGRAHDVVDRAVTDMNAIIERLLQVERLEDQQIIIKRDHFDLLVMARDLAISIPHGEKLQIKAQGPIVLDSDEQLVRVILSNLLDNALKYSTAGTQVNVTLTEVQDSIRVLVENEIQAWEVLDTERVFDKYYRGDHAHKKTGSGLGLYLTRSLLKLLGGEISSNSSDNQVRFEVVLPRIAK